MLNFNFNSIYSFLLTVLYRNNCKKSFAQIAEEGIRPKYIYIYIYIDTVGNIVTSKPFNYTSIRRGKQLQLHVFSKNERVRLAKTKSKVKLQAVAIHLAALFKRGFTYVLLLVNF